MARRRFREELVVGVISSSSEVDNIILFAEKIHLDTAVCKDTFDSGGDDLRREGADIWRFSRRNESLSMNRMDSTSG